MFSTSITRTFNLTTPIFNAGMAMVARPALAAAVCEAGVESLHSGRPVEVQIVDPSSIKRLAR